jgi:hypothetical protein
MDDIGFRVCLGDLDKPPGRNDVVLHVGNSINPANLGVCTDDHITGCDSLLPAVSASEIGLDDPDVGVQPSQDRSVGGMFVDCHDVSVLMRLQTQNKVLADETGGAGNRNRWRHPLSLLPFQEVPIKETQFSPQYSDFIRAEASRLSTTPNGAHGPYVGTFTDCARSVEKGKEENNQHNNVAHTAFPNTAYERWQLTLDYLQNYERYMLGGGE